MALYMAEAQGGLECA